MPSLADSNPYAIDPEVWAETLDAMRSYPGMGACRLAFHPYERWWDFEINYANASRFTGRDTDPNEAMRQAVAKLRSADKDQDGTPVSADKTPRKSKPQPA